MIEPGGIRWITIDATGTLIDPHPSVGHVYSAVLARHGMIAPHEQLQQRFIEVFRSMTQTPRGAVSEATEYAFWKRLVMNVVEPWANNLEAKAVFEDAYAAFASADNWRAPTGADDLLRDLKARGYKLALLSNADARCRGILEKMGLAQYLEHILLSCELGYEKPDLRLFRRVEEVLGARPAEILHVGDSRRNDGEGPEAAGWRALVIGRDIDTLGSIRKILL
jgi:putative hydrolase of the HAD superfamily